MLWLLLAGCAAGPETPAPQPWHWVDADGRTVLYRGVNLNGSAKRDETYHHGLSADALALLPAHGVTLVRLLVFWEAVEPEQGSYDATYLAQVRADVEALDALGLDVVLDLHQDVYGEGFGYTGFPAWTCDPSAYDAFVRNDEQWFLNYADENVVGCFDAFWQSAALQEAYAAAAARLVAEVADLDNLVGLDVINEPYWGSATVAAHDTELLPAFYGRVLSAVRAVHATLWLFLAPSVAANLTVDPMLDLSSLDDPYLGFTPHFYPSYAELGSGWDGDFTTEAQGLQRLARHAREIGAPLFLGEFGIFSAEGNEDDYVRAVLSDVQADGGSAAYWSYDHGSNILGDGDEAGWLLPVLGEPYVHRVPGRLESVDGDTVAFTLYGEGEVVWVADGECAAEADGGDVIEVTYGDGRVRVDVVADGLMSLRLACP